MIKNQEHEFIAVRVQDPRVQNEGSWNSYVDFKIFLHTNSKAFTAKTSCVRRRYSEFVWLKKKLQKNAGLVPVPDLPSKSLFSFSSEDFLERRRKGLQGFLDKVLHMTVCLSDSQLHLFLQTQLPLGHIQDCVQGHTPYTVTEAILTYASSNRGWAQEEDMVPEWSLTPVPYESMESPVPHLPTMPSAEPLTPTPPTSTDPAPQTLEAIADVHDLDTVRLRFNQTENPSLAATLEHSCGEAVLEERSPAEATSGGGSLGGFPPEEETREDCRQQQTPVEVHRPEGVEDESVLVAERAQEEGSPAGGAEETIPQGEGVTEPSSLKETWHGDTPEKLVPEPVRHAEPTQDDNTPFGWAADANVAGWLDDGQGHGGETGGREEDDIDAEAVLEVEDPTRESEEVLREEVLREEVLREEVLREEVLREEVLREEVLREEVLKEEVLREEVLREEAFREESKAVDGEEEEDEEEMLPGGDRRQDEDRDGQSRGETSSDGSSLEESASEDGGLEETSQVTNGYMETTPDNRHHRADAELRDTTTPDTKTNPDPSPDRGSAQTNDVREIVRVEVGENKEILYMSNICPDKTLEQMSSGLEEINNPEIRDSNHLESSGEHSTDDISLSVVPDTEAPVKHHDREVQEFTADTNLTLSRETEP